MGDERAAEVAPLYKRAIGIYERAADNRQRELARTVNNLGVFWKQQGELTKAEEMYRRTLAIHEKVTSSALPLPLPPPPQVHTQRGVVLFMRVCVCVCATSMPTRHQSVRCVWGELARSVPSWVFSGCAYAATWSIAESTSTSARAPAPTRPAWPSVLGSAVY